MQRKPLNARNLAGKNVHPFFVLNVVNRTPSFVNPLCISWVKRSVKVDSEPWNVVSDGVLGGKSSGGEGVGWVGDRKNIRKGLDNDTEASLKISGRLDELY